MNVSKNVFKVQVVFFFIENSDFSMLKIASMIQETFKAMFPTDPQMLPLPSEAPRDVPRCIFQNPEGSATLTISLSRVDFNAEIKTDASWKNFQEVIAYSLFQICNSLNIGIRRIGLVVQAQIPEESISEVNDLVVNTAFKVSDEKNFTWVDKEEREDGIRINIVNSIQINHSNVVLPNIIMIDANTHNDTPLEKDNKNVLEIVEFLLSKIEGRLNNVI